MRRRRKKAKAKSKRIKGCVVFIGIRKGALLREILFFDFCAVPGSEESASKRQ